MDLEHISFGDLWDNGQAAIGRLGYCRVHLFPTPKHRDWWRVQVGQVDTGQRRCKRRFSECQSEFVASTVRSNFHELFNRDFPRCRFEIVQYDPEVHVSIADLKLAAHESRIYFIRMDRWIKI